MRQDFASFNSFNIKSMRFIITLFLVSFVFGCSSGNNKGQLNGTWIPLEEEIGGAQLPKEAFEGQKLVIKDELYTMTAESVDKGVVSISGDKIDIEGRQGPNAGRQLKAIYKLENEQLTICYNLNGDSYPESFSTQGNPMLFLVTFEKVK